MKDTKFKPSKFSTMVEKAGISGFSGNEIGIDLGTRTVNICIKGQGVVLEEPSVVAVNTKTNEVIAVGDEAFYMVGKTPSYIKAEFPLDKGVIANHLLTQEMVRYFVKKVSQGMAIKPKVAICVPSSITEVESMAVVEAAVAAGARQVYLIEEPIAAALGSGLDIREANGYMIVDIGGGTTDIAVISLNGTVKSISVNRAGNDFDEETIRIIKNKYDIVIGNITAEKIKKEIGNVYEADPDLEMEIKGKHLISGLPKKITISQSEIVPELREFAMKIVDGIKECLDDISPELVGDIYYNGICLTGGGGKIQGLDQLIEYHIGTKCFVSDNAQTCVAEGSAMSLDRVDELQEGFKQGY